MPLIVTRSLEIDSLPFRVWDVITKPELNSQWAPDFHQGMPFRIESDWHIGSPVVWKDAEGQTVVTGTVTRMEPERLVRFTVLDVRAARHTAAGEEDGITFELSQVDGRTRLLLRQGDFSRMPDGQRYYDMSTEIWSRALQKIKKLAEAPSNTT